MQNSAEQNELVVYEIAKGKKISVQIERESVWLTQAQMSELFDKDVNTIGEHIGKIYKEKELHANSTTRDFREVRMEGNREVKRKINAYNLDVIISVGYRVKSQRGTQFRIWATKVLRDHILKGYSINKNRLQSIGLDELERAVKLIRQTIESKVLTGGESKGILQVITDYAQSWILLHKYDEGKLPLQSKTKPIYELTYEFSLKLISELVANLKRQKHAAKFVGLERDDHGLERLLGTINQTFGGQDLYRSVEEKAAHLLYFVIKDHPFIDGNKRSGSLLFIHYLAQNGLLFRKSGERTINDNAIVALALLISQSHPHDKDIMIRLITNLLK